MAKEGNNTTKMLVVRLDLNVPFERELMERYNAMPKSRRQEMLRGILRAGLSPGREEKVSAEAFLNFETPKNEAEDVTAKQSGKQLVGLFNKRTDN